jgi:hypothetical protein
MNMVRFFNLKQQTKDMSQDSSNRPGERQGNSGRASNESQNRKRYEGFEGMNFEQIRQPYNPQSANRTSDPNDNGNDRKREDE